MSEIMRRQVDSCRCRSARTEKNLTSGIRWRTHVGLYNCGFNRRWSHPVEEEKKKSSSASMRNTLARLCDCNLIDRLLRGRGKKKEHHESRQRWVLDCALWLLHWWRRSLSDLPRADVLQVYPLFKAIGLIRLLNVHSRGIHPLKRSLTSGVGQIDNDKVCIPFRVPGPARELLRNEHWISTESSLQGSEFVQLPSLDSHVKTDSKSSASHVTLSWTRQLRIKKSILTQIEWWVVNFLMMRTFRMEKQWQPLGRSGSCS